MRICIATSDIMGPIRNGGVGTSLYHLAKLASRQGHSVDILFCNQGTDEDTHFHAWQCEYKAIGINLISLKNAPFRIEQGHVRAAISYLAFLHLKDKNYDLILFPEMHGLGYYSLCAKKCGTHFQNTLLWVMFHGPTEWHLLHNKGLPTSLSDLSLFFIESRSTQMADRVLFATEHSKSVAQELGYLSPQSQVDVLLFPYLSDSASRSSSPKPAKIREVCFFGRWESRKGMEVFLKAILEAKPFLFRNNITVSLLGNEGWIDSRPARQYLESWSLKNHFPLKFVTGKNHLQAIEYVRSSNALVVLASLAETMGYTLIECIVNRIPFICSDIDPYKEVARSYGKGTDIYFESGKHEKLARKLIRAIQKPPRFSPDPHTDIAVRKKWENLFRRAEKEIPSGTSIKKPNAKVSVCIPHRDRGEFLKASLESLKPIQDSISEILIYDDASKNPSTLRFLKSLGKSDAVRVIFGKKRRGPGFARNALAKEARSEYLFFIDDDNLLESKAFRKILPLLDGKTDIIVSPLMKFTGEAGLSEDPGNLPIVSHWCPVGDALSMNILQNLIGDANLVIRKDFFQLIGGYSHSLDWGEDHELLLRAVARGARYVLSPESFIFYRVHSGNLGRIDDIEPQFRKMLQELIRNCSLNPETTQFISLFRSWAHRLDSLTNKDEGNVRKAVPLINPERRDLKTLLRSGRTLDPARVTRHISNPAIRHEGFFQIDVQRKVRETQGTGPNEHIRVTLLSPRDGILLINGELEVRIRKGVSRFQLSKPRGAKIAFSSPNGLASFYLIDLEAKSLPNETV